jgi:hypothetical protein
MVHKTSQADFMHHESLAPPGHRVHEISLAGFMHALRRREEGG